MFLLFALTLSSANANQPQATPEPSLEAVIVDLPFEDDSESNTVTVNLAPIGHRPFILVLDTGASGSVLTPLAARASGVTVRRQKETPYRRATSLGVDLQFRVDTTGSDTGSKTGWEYGLLGGNFLRDYVVEIDFTERRVRFLDPKIYQVPERVEVHNEVVLPFRLVGSRPFVPIELNEKSLELMFDTGAGMGLILSGQAAKALGVALVLPDSPASRLGLQVGDLLQFEAFEGTPSVSECLKRIALREPIQVLRRTWSDNPQNDSS
jgi:predicted aspartyl protease